MKPNRAGEAAQGPSRLRRASPPSAIGKVGAWANPAVRAAAIGAVPPFVGWSGPALLRLAQAAQVRVCAAGERLFRHGSRYDQMAVVPVGAVESSVTASDGRRVVFAIEPPGRAHGVIPLVDGQPWVCDVIFPDGGVALMVPMGAIQAELAAHPALWATVAREVNGRARRYTEQLKSALFDALRPRAASLLLGLLESRDHSAPGPAQIPLRLPQERFAEMLGVTRQTVTALVRELVREGLLQWRYGRVTLLDLKALQAVADTGIDRLAERPVVARRRAG